MVLTQAVLSQRLSRLPGALDRVVSSPRCVLAAQAGRDVLAALGVHALCIPVRVVVLTAHGFRNELSAFQDVAPGKWAGHLITYAPFLGLAFDFDLAQMRSPQHGCEVPRSLGFEWTDLAKPVEITQLPGVTLTYEHAPENIGYLESPAPADLLAHIVRDVMRDA